MRNILAAWLPPLAGVLLAGALLYPEPDVDALHGQVLGRALATPPSLLAELPPLPGGELALRITPEPAVVEPYQRAISAVLNVESEARAGRGETALQLNADADAHLDVELGQRGGELILVARVATASASTPLGTRSAHIPTRAALIPPLLAILAALVLRRPIAALFCGIWTGAALLQRAAGADPVTALGLGLFDVFAIYLRGELVNSFRIEIIGFVFALIAMVGVISRGGGVQGLVDRIVRYAKTVRSTLVVSFGMGVMIFFDDYSNCLIVGNTMRPLTDRLRISREKLAYVVDSTAAPIAGLSLLSTWIAFEVSTYAPQLPAAGITDNPYAIFLQSLPFRYYSLFTLGFVLMVALAGRDFGPMRAAEARARRTGQLVRSGGRPMASAELTAIAPSPLVPPRARNAVLPITTVVLVILHEIFRRGGGYALSVDELLTLEGVTGVLFAGSGGGPIFVGASVGLALSLLLLGSNPVRIALLAGVAAAVAFGPATAAALAPTTGADLAVYAATALILIPVFLGSVGLLRGVPTRGLHVVGTELASASFSSMRALSFAVVILFEAWMIGQVCQDIGTADYLIALSSGVVSALWLPVLLFGLACLVSFSTGTSWGTMSILLPNVVGLAAAVGATHPVGSVALVVVCIGAVLEGSIFGDHCSPISDTTVLSSVSAASDHIDHVRTQIPYALSTAAVAVLAGYLPALAFSFWSLPLALGSGFAVLAAVLWLFGRRAPE